MQKRIKFTTTAITQIGTFSTGDIATVDGVFADHCVNEAKCAEYADAAQVPAGADAEDIKDTTGGDAPAEGEQAAAPSAGRVKTPKAKRSSAA